VNVCAYIYYTYAYACVCIPLIHVSASRTRQLIAVKLVSSIFKSTNTANSTTIHAWFSLVQSVHLSLAAQMFALMPVCACSLSYYFASVSFVFALDTHTLTHSHTHSLTHTHSHTLTHTHTHTHTQSHECLTDMDSPLRRCSACIGVCASEHQCIVAV
jgi:hypothetical protein